MSVSAFSKASRVMIWRGVRSCSNSARIARPTRSVSPRLAVPVAGMDELKGRLMPIASMALAMVLAVYMPPQAPGPGQAFLTTAR